MPDHPTAMKSHNWNGYVYEHIAVMEKFHGRELTQNEIVHHLDGNKFNNRHENLIVLQRADHWKLHTWLDNTTITPHDPPVIPSTCKICERTLQDKQKIYCSVNCRDIDVYSTKPTKNELIQLRSTYSRNIIGKMYNVSGNSVKKWERKYGIS